MNVDFDTSFTDLNCENCGNYEDARLYFDKTSGMMLCQNCKNDISFSRNKNKLKKREENEYSD